MDFCFYEKSSRYLIVAPSEVRPGQVYRITANLLYSPFPLTITATVECNDEEIAGTTENLIAGQPQSLLMQVRNKVLIS